MAKEKKFCGICDKELGFMSMGAKTKDGAICSDCLLVASRTKTIKAGKYGEYDTATVRDIICQANPEYLSVKAERAAFASTKNIEKFLYIDENNKKFMVGKDGIIFNYSDLVGYELLEDNESITKGGLGGAVVGGLLAGGVGSMVGAAVGGKKSKSTCESMDIKLIVKNYHTDTLYIHFIGWAEKGCKTDSIHYKFAKDNAQKCLSSLMIITDENKPAAAPTPVDTPAVDTAAEIEKFHALMEKGIITQDEYNAKKAQLLGL